MKAVSDVWEWWKKQLAKIGQRWEDNPNGVQLVYADTVQTAKAPEFVCVSPVPGMSTPGILLSRNTSTGALSWTTQFQNGVAPVTEASAAAIASASAHTYSSTIGLMTAFGAPTTTDIELLYRQRRIFSVDLTSDGAGAVAATTIVPALAGYTGHAQLVGVWAHATDAATTFTFSCQAGTLLGPAVHVMATTANSITQFGAAAAGQTGCPVYIRGTLAADDNKNLQITVAGYANTETLTVFGYFWYET